MELSNLKDLYKLTLCGVIVVICLPSAASAIPFTWNGNAGTGLISNGGNWVGGSAPGSGSDLLFGAETGGGFGAAAFDAAITFNAPTVSFISGAPAGFFLTALSASDILNITGSGTSITNTSGSRMETSNLTISIGGSQTWDGGLNGLKISNIDLGISRTLTFTGTGTSAATRNEIGLVAAESSIDGTGISGIIKQGTGTLQFNGPALYTGPTTISQGILQLGASNRILDASNMTLDGGTFNTNGFDEKVGKLSLTNSSTIDFGTSNTSDLAFALSSDLAWGSFTLNIVNFNTGQDTLRFGTDNTGLTAAQLLNNIRFNGTTPGQIDSFGFVIPEPSAFGLALLGAFGLSWMRRRRL